MYGIICLDCDGTGAHITLGRRPGAGIIYGVSPIDPATFTGVSALPLEVALTAAYLPAPRDTRVAPVKILRCE